MAVNKVVKTVFQLRRATTAEWELNKHIIPASGEPCFDLNLNTLKIGNGVNTYAELKPIGGESFEISADGKSIVLDDNVLKLFGFDAAEVGAQPRKGADGNIEWIVPSAETVDGLQATVAGLQSDMTGLQTEISDLKAIVGTTEEGTSTLLDRVESLETQIGGIDELFIDSKIDEKINEFINKTSDDHVVNTLKELIDYVAEHDDTAESIVKDIQDLKGLVGLDSVQDQIAHAIANSGHMSKVEAENKLLSKVDAKALYKKVKYEISHKPEHALVDYRDKEIRVMIPANTEFAKQNSGANADADAYYIGFKAYAPDGAVSFKEDMSEIIADQTMHAFEGNDFAGIDAYGRKYSIVWLPVAKFANETWTYYGATSNKDKYIGWYYSVEWYGSNGKMIGSDCIRINLSNEACHNNAEPYYMNKVVKSISVNGTLLDKIDGNVNITIPEFKSSDEIAVNDDGTLSIKKIGFDKIEQPEDAIIVMDGGSAV